MIIDVDAAPVANVDPILTDENTSVTINVVEGSSVSGNTLTTAISSKPSNGLVTLNAGGTVVYTPDADFYGQDSFVYTISDGKGGTDTATGTHW